jgi:hypothetical protein
LDDVPLLPCQPLLHYYCKTVFPRCDAEEQELVIPCTDTCYDAIDMCKAELGEVQCKPDVGAILSSDDIWILDNPSTAEEVCSFFTFLHLYGYDTSAYICRNGKVESVE